MPEASAQPLLRPHYPALDGLRGLAVLSVCLTHYCTLAWPALHDVFFWGFSTVDLFFVLSGFLITGVLLDTRPFPRFFLNFYIRRALRILPVFLFAWAILFLLAIFLHPVWDWYHLSYLVYLGNLYMPAGAAGYHTDPSYFYYLAPSGHRFYATIGHLWTLCQEEQFYLIWPLVIWLIPNRKLLFRLCLAGALAVLALRIYLATHADPRLLAGDLLYYNPFTRFDSHLIGAALALHLRIRVPHISLLRCGIPPTPQATPNPLYLLLPPILIFIALQITLGRRWPLNHHNPVVSTIGFTLDCIASTGLLLLCLDPATRTARALSHAVPRALGRVSYAFYLFHYLPFQFFANQRPRLEAHHLLFLIPTVALGVSYLAATLSYRFLEHPILRLKYTLAPNPRA
jgi:peptidoglycan/LPS O-acetylase OafA/YrhL